ncbi:MAG: hypothetical protein JWP89_3512 [Schlesneria sp.]|nr:hypothetical protein [Schlesneria sp.]
MIVVGGPSDAWALPTRLNIAESATTHQEHPSTRAGPAGSRSRLDSRKLIDFSLIVCRSCEWGDRLIGPPDKIRVLARIAP